MTAVSSGKYDLFPTYPIAPGRIQTGYMALAEVIIEAVRQGKRRIAIDGFGGVLWSELIAGLNPVLKQHPLEWVNLGDSMLPYPAIQQLITPFLGGDDPLFGKLCDLMLADFFAGDALRTCAESSGAEVTVFYSTGAALVEGIDFLIYVDVPKDEIQRRMRAKTITNLGARQPADSASMYKRFYFVDWQVLNRHKAEILPNIDVFVDGQNPSEPAVTSGTHLREALHEMAHSYFRVRPWMAPGPWGGQWMKAHFPDLPQDVPNYAWSFELITPENGLVLESGRARLECSFDMLMFRHYREVLGSAAEQFGYYFPIRFDYLDTFDGGNLSIQCHPRPEYIRQHFGEPFTQDETYYITTCEPGAQVYIGFRDGVNPEEFRSELERSYREGVTFDIERFVNRVEAHPHDIFLIPNGTVHGSGVNNLVLEISATPYIFTFKVYDWMRRDLEGNMRTLNIDRAFENFYFDRQENYVREHLVPKAYVLREGDGWREVFVGTHEALFYAVHRYEFEREISASTDGRCHILNLVEGDAVLLETANGCRAAFNFGETFVVPAAAGSYRLSPAGNQHCKVVCAFVK
jgi:mannose-6-phosphate isomerase class I